MKKNRIYLMVISLMVLLSAGINNVYAYKYDSYKKDSIILCDSVYYRILGNNLISNNSFDSNASGWYAGDGSTLSLGHRNSKFYIISGTTPTGQNGKYLRTPSNSYNNSITNNKSIRTSWSVSSGSMYYFSFYWKPATYYSSFGYFYLEWLDNTTSSPSSSCINDNTFPSGTSNTWNNVEFVSEASADYLRFAFSDYYQTYLDEFYLFEIEVASSEALDDIILAAEAILAEDDNDDLSDAVDAAKAVKGTSKYESVYDAAADDLRDAIYDYYQTTATTADPMDFTDRVVNPSFEYNPPYASGWTCTLSGNAVTVGSAEVKVPNVVSGDSLSNIYYMTPADGTYAFNMWYGYGNTGLFIIQQTIENIPNGVYSLSALAATGFLTSNVGEDGYLYDVNLFANDSVTIPASDLGRSKSIRKVLPEIVVGNHTLTIGMSSHNWFKVDDFRLTYKGYDAGVFTSKLDSLLEVAKAYDLDLLPNGVDSLLLEAISMGESAKESQATDDILAAISALYNVFPTVEAAIPSYSELDYLLEYIGGLKEVVVGTGALATSIDSAYDAGSAVYDGAESLQPDVEDMVDALQNFLKKISRQVMAYGTCVYPVDVSFFLENNSFEKNPSILNNTTSDVTGVHVPDGWTLSKSIGSNSGRQFCEGLATTFSGPGNRIAPDGDYHYNAWAGTIYSIDLHQEIDNLPAGYYSVSAYMLTRDDTKNNGQHIYLTYNNTTYESPSVNATVFEQLSTDFVYVSENGSIRLGAASSAGGGDSAWFAVDYFTLNYYRLPCTFYYSTDDATGDWSTAANWYAEDGRAVGELPVITSDVEVSDVSLTVDRNAVVRKLTIKADAQLTIGTGDTLTVNQLVLKSNSTGTATLIDTGAYLKIKSGGAVMEQYVTGSGSLISGSTGRGWYLASPMTDAKSKSFYNFGIYDIWSFSETKGDTTASSNPYTKIKNATTPLISGQSYQVRMWRDTTVRFLGSAFYTGDLNVKITRGTTAKKRGFNLVGNPYPSHVDLAKAMDFTTMSPTIWYRTANSKDSMVFDTYNCSTQVGTSLGFRGKVSNIVPPMQSLWVRLRTDGASDYVRFKNNQRSHGSATNLLRSAVQTDKEIVRLQISRNELNRDEVVLVYMDGATDAYEDYDSEKYFNGQRLLPEIWMKAGGTEVVINTLAPIETYREYPLGYLTYMAGYHKIKATEITVDAQVVIKDLSTGAVFDLTDGDEFIFYSAAYVDTESRFVLLVDKTKSALDKLHGAENISVLSGDKSIEIIYDGESSANVEVYSLLGAKVAGITLNGTQSIAVPAGVYMVKVTTDGQMKTNKIIVK